jgi:hypothetical protein
MANGERRNYRLRAATVRRIVEWLGYASRGGVQPVHELPEELAPRSVIERVLRRLMLRCLARRVGTGWIPTPPLLHPAQLVKAAMD